LNKFFTTSPSLKSEKTEFG